MRHGLAGAALLTVAGLVGLPGCREPGAEPDGETAGEPQAADTTDPGGDAAGSATPVFSDTTRQREVLGFVTLAEPVGSFRPCGADESLRLVDRTDDRLRDAYASLTTQEGDSVFVEAVGRTLETAAPAGGAAEAASAVEVMRLRRVSPAAETSGCRPPLEERQVLARGNEPFWSVDVLPDQVLFREPENLDGLAFPAPEEVEQEGRRLYRSRRETAPELIELVLTEEPCRDSMSGAWFHLTAIVTLGDRTLHGCASEAGPPRA